MPDATVTTLERGLRAAIRRVDDRITYHASLRCPQELWDELKDRAHSNGVSVNSLIIATLREALEETKR